MSSRDTFLQEHPSECPDRILGVEVSRTPEVNNYTLISNTHTDYEFTSITTQLAFFALSPLLCQFVSLPLLTWSRSTLRFPASHLIGCSPAGSGSFRRWMLVYAVVTHQPVGVWWLLEIWALAKPPSLPAWWHSVVMGTDCGQVLPATKACQYVSRERWLSVAVFSPLLSQVIHYFFQVDVPILVNVIIQENLPENSLNLTQQVRFWWPKVIWWLWHLTQGLIS